MNSSEKRSRVLIDTSAWMGFFSKSGNEGIKEKVRRWLDQDQVATAGPIVLELLQGCRSPKERMQLEQLLGSVHWLPTQDHHWFQAGEMAFSLRRRGLTISAIDALIATLAETYDCLLLHRDHDFELIARYTNLNLIELGSS